MVYDPRIRAGIFAGESGGDYDALFGFSNRPGKQWQNIKPTEMTVGQVMNFTGARGPGTYANWARGQVGRIATPVGAYQIVGTTLKQAVRDLGLDPNTKFDQKTQDRLGQYILEKQGTGAWEGYRGPGDPGKYGGKATSASGLGPGRGSTKGTGAMGPSPWESILAAHAAQQEKESTPRSRLGRALTAFAANAPAMARGGQMDFRGMGRQGNQTMNRTIEFLRAQGRDDLAAAVVAGMPPGEAIQQSYAKPSEKELINAGEGRLYDPNTGEWVTAPGAGAPGSRVLTEEEKTGYGLPTNEPYQIDKDGKISKIGGGGVNVTVGGEKLTEGQSKSTVFLTMMDSAEETLNQFEEQGLLFVEGLKPALMQSPEYRQFENAASQWSEAMLRMATGAAAPDSEVERYRRLWFPVPNDPPEEVKRKRMVRERMKTSIGMAAGPGAAILDAPTPGAPGAPGAPPAPTGGSDQDPLGLY